MKTYDIVLSILRKYPKTRSNDSELAWQYMVMTAQDPTYLDGGFLTKRDFFNLPYETITRCRRKIRELHPELSATPLVQRWRSELQSEKGTHIYRSETAIGPKGVQEKLAI